MNRRLAVLRSITIVSISAYIEYALGLMVSVWIARALGPADFGRYAFTVWLCGWLIVCSNHALTTSSTKFIAEADGTGERNVASHITYRLSQMQHLSSFVVVVLFLLGISLIRPQEWHGALLPAATLVVIATVAKANYGMRVAIGKGQEHFEPEAIATVLGGGIGITLVIAFSLMHVGLLGFIALFAIASLTLNLVNRFAYRHYCRPCLPGPIPAETSQRLSQHLRLTAALILLVSLKSGTIEMFLLHTFSTSTAIGFFAIAVSLTRGAVQLFSVGLTTTLLPYMAKSFGQHGEKQAEHFLTEATRFYWAAGIAIAGLGLVTTPEIIRLMYGNRYVGAIPAIETMLVLAGLLLVGNGIAAFQTVVDRQDDRVRITLIAMLANALFGIALVPAFGLAGAVCSYACARFTEFGLAVFYLRRATSSGLPLAPMARLFVVGSVVTALAWLVTNTLPGRYGFIAGGIVFMGLYMPLSVLVRYWNDEDYRLMTTITDRLGMPGRVLMRGLTLLQRS